MIFVLSGSGLMILGLYRPDNRECVRLKMTKAAEWPPQIADKVLASGGDFFYNVSMLIDKDTRQISMEFVSIEELVPSDH